MQRTVRRWMVLGCTLALAGGLVTDPTAGAAEPISSARHGSSVSRPLVSGPATGGFGVLALQADLTQLPQYGYVQDEYFFEGTAQAFDAVGTYSSNGVWPVTPSTTAPYKTRLIVRRPSDPRRFNGTVVVEWLNVTAGFDTSPDWQYSRVELMRKGYVWVGISAQFVGVESPGAGLKRLDPIRYSTLSHPGDIYSYDIFSQAAMAVRRPRGVNPLPGFRVRHLIADGESQSASRMTTYVNAISPIARVYDAFLIHSRSSGASALSSTGPGSTLPNPAFIRTDISTPVFVVEAETDVPRHASARQGDSQNYRLWEIAGTSHADEYMLGIESAGILGCVLPVNRGPQHYVFHTALRDLRRWMLRPWRVPPTSPLITLDSAGNVARDASGNALGGIRTPQIDVPIATFSGFGNSPGLCSLFGTTTPFTNAQLVARYGNQDNYRIQYLFAQSDALSKKFLLLDDGWTILAEAANFSFAP